MASKTATPAASTDTAPAEFGEFTVEAATNLETSVKGPKAFLKLPEGKTVIRILPPKPGQANPFAEVRQHYVKLPTGNASFNCPKYAATPRACPVCAQFNTLNASPHKADKERAKQFSPKPRIFVNVLVRAQESPGPKILGFGSKMLKEFMRFMKDSDWGNFTHPVTGYDFAITKSGQMMETEYGVSTTSKGKSPLSNDPQQVKDWIAAQHDLSKWVAIPTDEEINAKLAGDTGDDAKGRAITAGSRAYDAGSNDDDRPF